MPRLTTLSSLTVAAAAALVGCLTAGQANAQFVTYYSPIAAAPVPVFAASPVVAGPVVAAPFVSAPVATVVARPIVAAPVATVVARPVVSFAARPVSTVAFSPVVAPAPALISTPVVTNVPVVTTRFRPLLGGSVTRVRYRPVVTSAVVPAF